MTSIPDGVAAAAMCMADHDLIQALVVLDPEYPLLPAVRQEIVHRFAANHLQPQVPAPHRFGASTPRGPEIPFTFSDEVACVASRYGRFASSEQLEAERLTAEIGPVHDQPQHISSQFRDLWLLPDGAYVLDADGDLFRIERFSSVSDDCGLALHNCETGETETFWHLATPWQHVRLTPTDTLEETA